MSRAIFETAVEIPMRDGVMLRADLLRPDDGEPAPTLLLRSPYPSMVARKQLDQLRAVENGFAVVVQSIRGTGNSSGEFAPWIHDVQDGEDTIAWCARQPWSSGAVGTVGGSYLGQVQLYAASASPPALRAMAPSIVPSHAYDIAYQGGALQLGTALYWSLFMTGSFIARDAAAGTDVGDAFAAWLQAVERFDEVALSLPLRDVPVLQELFPPWTDWMDHPSHDAWWHASDVRPRPAIPTLFTTGWWDLFLRGTLDEWAREPKHPSSRLVIGPWSHALDADAQGAIYYGAQASAAAQDVEGTVLAFLGHHLDARELVVAPRVRVFVMGSNTWRDFDDWPVSSTPTRLYLQPGSGLSADGPLPRAAPIRFTFDPRYPVPTLGGRNLMPGADGAFLTGQVDQSPLDMRADLVRFTGDALVRDVEVIGDISVTLHASTTAADTDWTAKLTDVFPDGRSYNVADGIIRARYSVGTRSPRFLAPGSINRFDIDLAATAYTFRAGHRIRVEISSSNFPRFDRNPGSGLTSAEAGPADLTTAEQTVYLDASRPSWITLPVTAD